MFLYFWLMIEFLENRRVELEELMISLYGDHFVQSEGFEVVLRAVLDQKELH